MRWSVYYVEPGRVTIKSVRGLGYVNALSQPFALAAAWKRWPKLIDRSRVQAGFTVQPYAKDHRSLGKLHTT